MIADIKWRVTRGSADSRFPESLRLRVGGAGYNLVQVPSTPQGFVRPLLFSELPSPSPAARPERVRGSLLWPALCRNAANSADFLNLNPVKAGLVQSARRLEMVERARLHGNRVGRRRGRESPSRWTESPCPPTRGHGYEGRAAESLGQRDSALPALRYPLMMEVLR